MRKKSNKSSMRKQNSIILAFFIISVLLSGCGIKGPLTQKSVQEKTNNAKTEQKQNSSAGLLQEN
ncbi:MULTISPECIES: LPS translocon maturation chaperone LptM [unclassified Colwellia]|uniref:LPS translocon maturation chaperone LptM n=1 Tax=unclassified Colwellia TaxID=196834 RepID=UPI0015F592E9|nr:MULTISPECIES: lipoprotein [unclassified Colwellia]MBA6231244.1 lipoprotein [Colwellia sp. MB02u-7]MBA6238351.1 lipoprotein [Colwellia sp. MB02u-11]MBA6255125.1 lipoprotein [Colwellia sp. MB3u-28]MBA6260700.1 lipoprotein [Colwellia sp. MB3u-41]MBA6299072.1 lipoprotein [Colwellia sp. MB3u-22]